MNHSSNFGANTVLVCFGYNVNSSVIESLEYDNIEVAEYRTDPISPIDQLILLDEFERTLADLNITD